MCTCPEGGIKLKQVSLVLRCTLWGQWARCIGPADGLRHSPLPRTKARLRVAIVAVDLAEVDGSA